ncbi:MAG: rhodanese-like domain-containing protein [Phycisphaerales bacterium]|jgi:rhodanese-related sulfurtransferase
MGFLTLVQRACTLALLGVLAGAVHSALEKPLQLAPKPPAPPIAPANAGVVGGHSPAANSSGGSTARGGPPASVTEAPVKQDGVLGLDITLDQAWELYQQGTPFVDARGMDEYIAGHIDSAFWMPTEEFMSGHTPAALPLLDSQSQIVVYCDGGMCDASKNVVVLLQQAGFTRCHILTDGYPAWAKANRPIATGKPQIGGN